MTQAAERQGRRQGPEEPAGEVMGRLERLAPWLRVSNCCECGKLLLSRAHESTALWFRKQPPDVKVRLGLEPVFRKVRVRGHDRPWCRDCFRSVDNLSLPDRANKD